MSIRYVARVRGSSAGFEAAGLPVEDPDATAETAATAGHDETPRAVRPDPRVPRDRA
jgi:hypothetical protein